MQCDVCGNNYARSFEVTIDAESYTFDCFECAIHRLAPECEHCGCKVIGHGVSAAGGTEVYCCDHCLRAGSYDDDEADDGLVRSSAGRLHGEEGAIGWILLWLIGIPIPLLLLFFLLRGCT